MKHFAVVPEDVSGQEYFVEAESPEEAAELCRNHDPELFENRAIFVVDLSTVSGQPRAIYDFDHEYFSD